MNQLSGLALLVASVASVGTTLPLLLAQIRGADWYSDEGARQMRRYGLVSGLTFTIGYPLAAVLLVAGHPDAAFWAIPAGVFALVLGIVVLMFRRRQAIDPARREELEGPAARKRLSLVLGIPFIAAGVAIVLVVGAIESWLIGLAVGGPTTVLGLVFFVLVRREPKRRKSTATQPE